MTLKNVKCGILAWHIKAIGQKFPCETYQKVP